MYFHSYFTEFDKSLHHIRKLTCYYKQNLTHFLFDPLYDYLMESTLKRIAPTDNDPSLLHCFQEAVNSTEKRGHKVTGLRYFYVL